MLIKIKADDSASQYGVVVDEVAGFPVTDLHAIYLMDDNDGAVGAGVTTLTDASGNGNAATALSGSDAVRIAAGLGRGGGSGGYGFATGLDARGGFAVVYAFNIAYAAPVSGNNFTNLVSLRQNLTLPLTGSQTWPDPAVALNQQTNDAAQLPASFGIFETGALAWEAGSVRVGIQNLPIAGGWAVIGFAHDPVAKSWTTAHNGASTTVSSEDAISDWLQTLTESQAELVLGHTKHVNVSMPATAQAGLAALYDAPKTGAELLTLIANAKAILTDRGVSAV